MRIRDETIRTMGLLWFKGMESKNWKAKTRAFQEDWHSEAVHAKFAHCYLYTGSCEVRGLMEKK